MNIKNAILNRIKKITQLKSRKRKHNFCNEGKIVSVISIFISRLLWKLLKRCFKELVFFVKTDEKNRFLICPIRGRIGTKIYDETGNYTEEYYRINLVNSFLKTGIPKENLYLNKKIRIGHKGKNFFIPDLVITKKNKKCFLVAEVKKDSKNMKEALAFQLNPAVKILNAKYGIYYDGTKNSFAFKNNGEIIKDFEFLRMPNWIFQEWKNIFF